MNPGNIGFSGWVVILVIALIVFGPKKLPEIGRAFGETLREFKKSANGIISEVDEKGKAEGKETTDK